MWPFHIITLAFTLGLIYASPLSSTGVVLPLRRSPSSTLLKHPANLTSRGFGLRFSVDVTLGDSTETFLLTVDTGSSDTWVLASNWTCWSSVQSTSEGSRHRSPCNFTSKTYTPSPSYSPIPDMILGLKYGAGHAAGALGTETVTLAGLAVENQTIGVVDRTDLPGKGMGSGLLGLGYPALTTARYGTLGEDFPGYTDGNTTHYMPLFWNVVEKHGIKPYFSIALERPPPDAETAHGGYLSLGGLPPVAYEESWARTPAMQSPVQRVSTQSEGERLHWLVEPEGFEYGVANGTVKAKYSGRLAATDTGSPYTSLPSALAASIAAAFDPPAVLNQYGTYTVPCDAKAPQFGIKLGGKTFWHKGEDMFVRVERNKCVSSVTSDSGPASYVDFMLGDPFFRNVVAVHDIGKNELRFAARK